MTITYRDVKDEALTYAELDENFRDLREDTDLERVLINGNVANLTITVPQVITNVSFVGGSNVTQAFIATNNYTRQVGAASNAWTNTQIAATGSAANAYALSIGSSLGSASNSYADTVGAAANNWANTKLSNSSITISGGLKMSDIHLLSNVTITLSSNVGNVGQVSWDGDYLYVCVAPNQWKRTQLLSW